MFEYAAQRGLSIQLGITIAGENYDRRNYYVRNYCNWWKTVQS
jgi:hypothetical protein